MKRIAFVILLALALALFSCSDADEPSTDAPTDEVTAEKTDKPTEKKTERPTSRPRPTEPALDAPADTVLIVDMALLKVLSCSDQT